MMQTMSYMSYDAHVNRPYGAARNFYPVHSGPSRRPMRPRPDNTNEPPRSQQVCLDHLKGICTLKRARCRYAHPPITAQMAADAAAIATSSTIDMNATTALGVRVCEVYALTGFCKFGSQCRDYHPPTGVYGPVCAPACTWKMGRESRNAAGAVAQAQCTDVTVCDEGAADFAAARTQTAQRLRRICVETTTEEAFDAAFTEAAELLSCHEDTGAVLQQLAPLLYASAIGRADGAPHIAKWCRYLFTLAPHDTRAALRAQMTSSCGNLLYHVDTFTAVIASEEEKEALDRKRLNNVKFISHLLVEGLVHQRFFEQAVDYLLLCSSRQGGEGTFCARLLCAVLGTAGRHLPAQFGGQAAQRLRDLSARFPEAVRGEIEEATQMFPVEEYVNAVRASTPPMAARA